jgi:hypothetical protein
MLRRAALLTLALTAAPACLVVTLHPGYDDDSIAWNPVLLGTWQSQDDETVVHIEQDEWRSYRISYQHPIESGELTGYLTTLGDELYLDVMPARGQDRGAFVVPVHAVIRIRVVEGRLELTPLAYDWFLDRVRKGAAAIPGLAVTRDQRENALVTSTSGAFRRWLRQQPAGGPVFGATTVFARKDPKQAGVGGHP